MDRSTSPEAPPLAGAQQHKARIAPASSPAPTIAVIGVSFPFRGGIAHYSTQLVRALRQRHAVEFITFTRQYPDFLFPGRTQYDDSADPIVECNERLIDSVGPFSWLRTARRLRRLQPSLIVFNWWHPFFGAAYGTIVRLLPRELRARVCFLCHNVLPHEQHGLARLLSRYAFRHVQNFIVHSEPDRQQLLELKPHARTARNCHPISSAFVVGPQADKAHARKQLELPADRRVLLFFGLIRPYKGLAYLIRAMALVRRHIDCVLLVAGEFYEDKEQYLALVEEAGVAGEVRFDARYIKNEEVPLYFRAADVAVLPYVEASQSGIVPMAYGFNTPVISTRVGGLPEAVRDEETGFLVEPRSAEALARAIVRYYEGDWEQRFRAEIARQSARFGWDEEIEHIELFMREARS
jgi:glycosyltransferase involved in cell wall biosynthesis